MSVIAFGEPADPFRRLKQIFAGLKVEAADKMFLNRRGNYNFSFRAPFDPSLSGQSSDLPPDRFPRNTRGFTDRKSVARPKVLPGGGGIP